MDDTSRKRIILEYIRLGQRQEALDYIMKVYGASELDAERLLLSVTANAGESTKIFEKPTSGSGGCGGCVGAAFKLGSIVFMMMSLSLLVTVAAIYFVVEREKGKFIELGGEVVALQETRDAKVYPVVEYKQNAKVYRDTIDMAVGPGEFNVGQKTEIFINPDYPGKAYLIQEVSVNALDVLMGSEVKSSSDLQLVELIISGVIYVMIVPGLIFFILSITFWMVGSKMSSK